MASGPITSWQIDGETMADFIFLGSSQNYWEWGSKEFTCNEGDPGLIPGQERCPGKGCSYLLQYSSLEHSMDRGAWWATVHGT